MKPFRKGLFALLMIMFCHGMVTADTGADIVEWEYLERLSDDHGMAMTLQLGLDQNRIPWTIVFVLENRSGESARLAVPGTVHALTNQMYMVADRSREAIRRVAESRTSDPIRTYEVIVLEPGESRSWSLQLQDWVDGPENLEAPDELDFLGVYMRNLLYILDEGEAFSHSDNEQIRVRMNWIR